MTSRPTYTPEQLEIYLQRIRYPVDSATNTRLQHLKNAIEKNSLAALTDLQRRHLCGIPWGNSALHYSLHRTISTDPRCVFEKLVTRGLDGYCMENTGLLYVVLRSVGYQVYPTSGRVSHAIGRGNDNGLYLPYGHMILIVTIDGRKYMVDVGFGAGNATRPLPLEENTVASQITPEEMRLVKETLAEFTDQSQKVWIYQTRYTPDSKWVPTYSFSEMEFLPQDFVVLNFFTSQNRTSFFTQAFMCTRMILDESGEDIQGQYIMSGKEVKRRVHGQSEVLQVLKTEEDRVQALARWFDMHLREEEIQGIEGLTSEMK